jgi:hypothetical protein
MLESVSTSLALMPLHGLADPRAVALFFRRQRRNGVVDVGRDGELAI